ncbi:ribonuclease inhibitor-like [Coregonus clupeaformis]|uniref:ribonuclease inhibitor-like n=1 Tax=Coregonus clupeaformis TaxID=59861 RepID=UPI001E1C5648|nr:ribonuclease inhibitor-like [Coregonus clupeaformis]
MGRSGPELLKAVLMGAHSQPLVLRLTSCDLKDDICETVASALHSAVSCLTELDLSYNKLTDTGVKQISSGLMSPHCNLKILRGVLWKFVLCYSSLSARGATSGLQQTGRLWSKAAVCWTDGSTLSDTDSGAKGV